MTYVLRSPFFRYASLGCAAVIAAAFMFPVSFKALFSAGQFLPHATCYLRNPSIIWLHVLSDAFIGIAYVAISSTLAYLVHKASKSIPFNWMFLAFGLFIVSCGFTHFMEIWTVWKPVYWLAGYVKLLTAVASVVTAVALFPLVPKVFALINSVRLSEERRVKLETAHKELEQLYAKVKAVDELKTNFFANVSHELRTPLALVLGNAERVRSGSNLTPRQQEDVSAIYRQATILLKHVNDLLDASKLEAGKMELTYAKTNVADLVRLTASNFEALAHERQIDFSLQVPQSSVAEVDSEKLQKVLLNLLSNAFKFVPTWGKIRCSLLADGERVRLKVEDNGQGVPENLRETIFERFQQGEGGSTRRFGGTGLGLAIARELVLLHKGRIFVERSHDLGGAAFIVELPAKAPEGIQIQEHAKADSIDEATQQTLESLRLAPAVPSVQSAINESEGLVLVVEDNPEMNRFISETLSSRWKVATALNGREGLEKAHELKPDLIITDIMMPEMSGDQLAKELRSRPEFEGVPLIVLTAKADDELRVQLLQGGVQDYLIKPFSITELQARVANFMAIRKVRVTLQQDLMTRTNDLLSLASETVQRKKDLQAALKAKIEAERALQELNQQLEERVAQRTADLRTSNHDLECFASTIAHDLRAPLRAIHGLTQALQEDHSDKWSPLAHDFSNRIIESSKRMDALISDLLDYSRVSRADFQVEAVNLKLILNESQSLLENELQRRNATFSEETVPVAVRAHPTLLIQVIVNLLSNAVKFVPKDRSPDVKVRLEDKEKCVRLWVEDNGLGIAEEHRDRIFRMFERLHTSRQYPGTGIGLAIVERAIRRMGGQVGLESEVNKGTRFWIELEKA